MRSVKNFILVIPFRMNILEVDALVCGGGMSGMACAAFASQAGAKTLVVEKQATLGGSSSLSAGMLYVFSFPFFSLPYSPLTAGN